MLSWLSVGAAGEQNRDQADTTAILDGPETPAHVFAARAFKYRLWGTPKPSSTAIKASQPVQQTHGDLVISAKDDLTLNMSPSKLNGILLTPGTANLRRSKTVTFGAKHDKDVGLPENATERQGIKVTVPGKFPTPSVAEIKIKDVPQNVQPQTKLMERLIEAKEVNEERAASTTRSTASEKCITKVTSKDDSTDDKMNWEAQYKEYAARTEREMKKLIAKRQAAKHFARDKDTEVSTLSQQLRNEQKKVTRLELRVNELTDQLALLSARLAGEVESPGGDLSNRPLERRSEAAATALEYQSQRGAPERQRLGGQTSHHNGDIWADAMASSPLPENKTERPVSITKSHRTSTLQSSQKSPLRPLDNNVLDGRSPLRTPSPSKSSRKRQANNTYQSDRRSCGKVRHRADDESLHLPEPSPEPAVQSSLFIVTPQQHPHSTLRQSGGAKTLGERFAEISRPRPEARSVRKVAEVGRLEADSPRKVLDDERRAKAAARIAARRREREKGRHGAT